MDRDRATYDPSTTAYVVYSVADPVDAPADLTFGQSFMSLAATYAGNVVLGNLAMDQQLNPLLIDL
jgi:hypothetical protein